MRHTYADGNANYTISATATDEDGTYAAGNTVAVTVNNVAPTLALSGAATSMKGRATRSACLRRIRARTRSASGRSTGATRPQIVSGNPSSVTHTYADGDASYTISATATDEDGTYHAGNTVHVTVHNVAPTLAISGAATSTKVGLHTELVVDRTRGGYDRQWTINWGDSRAEVVSGNPTSVSHTYADGTPVTRSAPRRPMRTARIRPAIRSTLRCNNVAPTLAISGAADVNEGASYTLNLVVVRSGCGHDQPVDDQLG